MRPSQPGASRGPLFGRPASSTDPAPNSAAKSNLGPATGPQGLPGPVPNVAAAPKQIRAGHAPLASTPQPMRPPAPPSNGLSNGFGNLSLNGTSQQPGFTLPPGRAQQPAAPPQPAPRFAMPPVAMPPVAMPPVGGGEYVQQHQQPPAQVQPPGPPGLPNRPAFPQGGARGPPAFGKVAAGAAGRAAPGAFGRPPSPGSPNSLYAIPMPASPSPTTSGRPLPPVQQPGTPQMPAAPGPGRGLAPPSFTKLQQVCCACFMARLPCKQ